jgi:hypothetical protein
LLHGDGRVESGSLFVFRSWSVHLEAVAVHASDLPDYRVI